MTDTILPNDELDRLVARTDELGGPDSAEAKVYWQSFDYRPRAFVDQSLDPFSREYAQQQFDLYRELSGRTIDQESNEMSSFALEDHVAAIHSYGPNRSPSDLALHYIRLGRAIRAAEIPSHAHVLDLGCGWGMTTEFLAHLGCTVLGVDINPNFVELVRRRAHKLAYPIETQIGNFDSFDTERKFDAILFYECFHHAMNPFDLAERATAWLKAEGKIVLAGEPIQSIWWKNWGMRLDPLSIYCIRKFGWFESGWSKEFLCKLFNKAGYFVEISDSNDPEIGSVIIAERKEPVFKGPGLGRIGDRTGWFFDNLHLISTGESSININVPNSRKGIVLEIDNFRGKDMKIRIDADGVESYWQLKPGANLIALDLEYGQHCLNFKSKNWIPKKVFGSPDTRELSFHLRELRFSV